VAWQGLGQIQLAGTPAAPNVSVERFDVDANGLHTQGVEDACSLLGLPPHEKYATAMERVLEATRV
jgi:hypothetical protein